MRMSLASVFAVIGKDSTALESKADSVLRIVKSNKLRDLKAFNAAVRAAYKANGWNGKPGKPKEGEEKAQAVPATVKQYVSAIRGAFRLKLPVSSYSSFYALRQEVKAKRAAQRKPAAKKPELVGFSITQPDTLNGAPFHDLAVVYNALDRTRRPKMLAALTRVKREFALAAPQLVVATPEIRAAA